MNWKEIKVLFLVCKICLTYETYIWFRWTCFKKEECIRKWLIYKIRFEKLNASSKEYILIEIDFFEDFIQTHIEFKSARKQGHFEFRKISWSGYKKNYMKTSNNIRFVYLEILLYICRNHGIRPLVLEGYK